MARPTRIDLPCAWPHILNRDALTAMLGSGDLAFDSNEARMSGRSSLLSNPFFSNAFAGAVFGQEPAQTIQTGDGTAVYFSEGIFNAYRWYDQQGITPLFSFGHGISYTTFEYSNLKVQSSKNGVDVKFNLKNNGSVAGSEVPQLYLGPPAKPLPEVSQYAPLKLAGFERVLLNPGESTSVKIHLDNLELSYWSTPAQQWAVAPGPRKIYVGAASDDIRLEANISVKR